MRRAPKLLKANSHRHASHDTDRTVLSCMAGGVNWALGNLINGCYPSSH